MPDFRCDAAYLSRVFSELRITDSYSLHRQKGWPTSLRQSTGFPPGKYAHDTRDEILCEARDIASAADIVKRILGAEVGRMNDSISPDFRTYALQEFGIDPRQAIAMVEGLNAAFRRARSR